MKKLFLVFSVTASSFGFSQQDTVVIARTQEQYIYAHKKASELFDIKLYESQVIKLVNEYRVSKGLNVLQFDSSLYLAADLQANYMSTNNVCTHYNDIENMGSPFKRIDYFLKRSTKYAGECCNAPSLILNYLDNINHAQSVFNLWKNSKAHNSILLMSNVNLVAVSISRDGNSDRIYACLVVCN
jgi:uncharacterized protein YkwD